MAEESVPVRTAAYNVLAAARALKLSPRVLKYAIAAGLLDPPDLSRGNGFAFARFSESWLELSRGRLRYLTPPQRRGARRPHRSVVQIRQATARRLAGEGAPIKPVTHGGLDYHRPFRREVDEFAKDDGAEVRQLPEPAPLPRPVEPPPKADPVEES